MTNNDENVVRTRLLLDGDGTGDDRRLNNIAKMVSSSIMFQTFLISFKPLLRILITSFIVRSNNVPLLTSEFLKAIKSLQEIFKMRALLKCGLLSLSLIC